MAADTQPKAVNGNYGAHQLYGQAESFQASQSSNASTSTAVASAFPNEALVASAVTPSESTSATEGGKTPSKDEVGWYFVESYYTTMSKNPDTLYLIVLQLYYNKRSQFVSGVEAEKVEVSVGQKAINDRIKQLDIQDCKVRVSNVDSQESGKDIVVQVIGEISNKAAAHRKFVQTFVLAEQPKGYFVLNDIFRYIIEDEDEDSGMENGQIACEEAAAAEADPSALTSSNNLVQQEHDIEQVDEKLEEEMLPKPFPADTDTTDVTPADGNTITDAAQVNQAEEAPVAAVEKPEEPAEAPEQAAESVAKEDEQEEPEKPRDADPTPIASPVKPAKAAPVEVPAPAASAKPAAPKTWANLVAANRIAAPAVPNGAPPTSTATPPASQTKTAPSTTNRSATPPPAASEENPAKAQQNGNSGWQMAGSDNNKKQGRQHGSSSSVSGAQEVFLGYVKNVTDKVDASILKTTLSQYGKLLYFDVSRPKNCAFVEFSDSASYNAAVAANPHSIGGEQIYVEERRPRANAYGGNYAQRGGMRGGRGANEGRPGSQPGRGGFPKDGGRVNYGPRGRGGSMTPRGRGQPQAA